MRCRVLATDVQERSMVATVRSLTEAGFRVTAVGSGRLAPGLWTQGLEQRRLAPDARRDQEGFVRTLEQILVRNDHDVLLPGTDVSLLTVSRHRDRLAPYVNLGLPSQEIVEGSLNKHRLAAEATRVGLSPPEATVCADPEAAALVARTFGYPVLVKPLHTVVEEGGSAVRRFSLLVDDDVSARSAAHALGTCIVQRFAHGPVVSFAGVATPVGLLSFVVSRYERTWPPQVGNASFSRTISPAPELVERVEALVAGLQWTGLFELELIEEPGGGMAAIDFNPRAYGSLSLAVAAGVRLPAEWCDWLLGRVPLRSQARIGVSYRWEDAELRNLLWRLRQRNASAALDIVRPRRPVAHAYFQARDPGPLFAHGLELARRAAIRARSARDSCSLDG